MVRSVTRFKFCVYQELGFKCYLDPVKIQNTNNRALQLEKRKEAYAKTEKFFGLTKNLDVDGYQYANYQLVEKNFDLSKLYTDATINSIELLYVLDGIDVKNPAEPKLTDDKDDRLKPEYITNYVKSLITLCKGKSLEFSKENIALLRYALHQCTQKAEKLGLAGKKMPAFSNENFINEISSFVQKEMDRIKDSKEPQDQENYNLLSIFKAAMKMTDDDIHRLESIENSREINEDQEANAAE